MQWHTQHDKVPLGSDFLGVMNPILIEWHHQDGVQNTANANPRGVKEDRYKLDSDGQKRQADGPGRKSLFVEHAPRNEKPRIEFDAQTCPHTPPKLCMQIRNENVQNGRQMMLYNRRGTFDTGRDQTNPNQIDDKIKRRDVKE
jgi:hypothetical protein